MDGNDCVVNVVLGTLYVGVCGAEGGDELCKGFLIYVLDELLTLEV